MSSNGPSNLYSFKPRREPNTRLEDAMPGEAPNYAGRLVCLNPDSGRRHFQCGGFVLGGKLQSAVVPEEAQMAQIHRAILERVLIDITESGAISTNRANLGTVEESESGKKVYFTQNTQGEAVVFATENPDIISEFDSKLARGSKLVLPEGFENEDKYLLNIEPKEKLAAPVAKPKRSLKARIKDLLHGWVSRI